MNGAPGAVVERLPKLHAVADAASVIDRQDDVAMLRQVLIHPVRVVVVVHVVPSQQHLPARAAMEENHRGPAFTRLQVGPYESKATAASACRTIGVPCFPVPAK